MHKKPPDAGLTTKNFGELSKMTDVNSGLRPAKSLVQLGEATTDLTWLVSEWEFGLSGLMQWSPDNVRVADDGAVELVLGRAPDGSGRPFQGGETQSSATSETGTWSWLAQAPQMQDGAVFGMFLFQEKYESDPWLEFDFEFVGSDTTKVELNIHMVNAQGERIILQNDPLVVDLGFDAAEQTHLYEIELTGTSAIFSIDNQVVATFDASDMPDNTWYSGQMRSFTNLWAAAPEMADWTGDWNYSGEPLVARIEGVGLPDSPLDTPTRAAEEVVMLPEPDVEAVLEEITEAAPEVVTTPDIIPEPATEVVASPAPSAETAPELVAEKVPGQEISNGLGDGSDHTTDHDQQTADKADVAEFGSADVFVWKDFGQKLNNLDAGDTVTDDFQNDVSELFAFASNFFAKRDIDVTFDIDANANEETDDFALTLQSMSIPQESELTI